MRKQRLGYGREEDYLISVHGVFQIRDWVQRFGEIETMLRTQLIQAYCLPEEAVTLSLLTQISVSRHLYHCLPAKAPRPSFVTCVPREQSRHTWYSLPQESQIRPRDCSLVGSLWKCLTGWTRGWLRPLLTWVLQRLPRVEEGTAWQAHASTMRPGWEARLTQTL